MPFADAGCIDQGAVVEADVCVVGAGPAGLAVALELAKAGVHVALFESGGLSVEPKSAGLNEFENAGLPLRADGPLRDRRFGGTAWYGRCVVLDPMDFETRAWVPRSGWPVPRAQMESRYYRAAQFLGLARPAALAADFWQSEPALRALSGGGIAGRVHLVSRAKDLGRRFHSAVAGSPRLTVFLHATVIGIEIGRGSRAVTRLRVCGPQGQEFSGSARYYVLACGGLENARLLLLLSADESGVLEPSSAALGRCYMDHARCEGVARLYLDPAHPDHRALFQGLTEGYSIRSRCRVQLAAGLDEETQRREELLNASAFVYGSSAPRLTEVLRLIDQLRRSAVSARPAGRDVLAASRLARDLPFLLRAWLAHLRRRPFLLDHLVVVEQLEQAPDWESRVVLSDRRDRFGRQLLRLHWRIGPDTIRTQRRLHQLLAERVRQLRVGRLESALLADPDWEPLYGDCAHPMGSTRMSHHARDGVVNGDCRVHAVDNLYLAGSSIFPTGGHANPTLALVALALRLAEHLRKHLE